jgi:hypothetical protein
MVVKNHLHSPSDVQEVVSSTLGYTGYCQDTTSPLGLGDTF